MRFQIIAAALVAISLLMPATIKSANAATIPEIMMVDLQRDLALTDFQAAAILGNLAQETGNFTELKQIGGSGLGYSQWTGSRNRDFKTFAENNNFDVTSHEANYTFLVHELTTNYSYVLDQLRTTKSHEEASRLFMRKFLRPSAAHANLPRRLKFGEAYLAGQFDGAGCYAIHDVVVTKGRMQVKTCPSDLVIENVQMVSAEKEDLPLLLRPLRIFLSPRT